MCLRTMGGLQGQKFTLEGNWGHPKEVSSLVNSIVQCYCLSFDNSTAVMCGEVCSQVIFLEVENYFFKGPFV